MAEQKELTGTQKAAVVLMQMSQEQAALVMSQLADSEAEDIAAEIVRLRRVDAEATRDVIEEFYELTLHGRVQARGGHQFAAGLLAASFGADRAAGLMERLASSMAGKSFEFLANAESGQIIALLDSELPETIALVLAHLRPERASAVLAGFPEEQQTDVAQCIATMRAAAPESVTLVADVLKVRAGAVVSPREKNAVTGGIQPLVDIINRSSISTEKSLLEALDARDPELAEEVRSRMLTFGDIVRFERRDVQLVLRGIDVAVLAVALRGASPQVHEVIKNNVSERNREILDDEIKMVGPVRASQVEEARADIVKAIRELESNGSIVVHRADEDDYVL